MTQTQNGLTIDYSYDALDQLLAVSSSTLTAQYTYTPNGTRASLTTPAATVNYAYDALDRLLSVTAQPSIGTPTAHSFTYDADGRMVTSGTRQFLWDEASTYGDIVAEFDAGQLDASYVLGGSRLISQTTGADSAYFLTDALGSTRALSDGSAALTDTFTYDAYGGLYSTDPFADFSTTATPYLFTGHRYDSALGLYHARARVYDPAVGRFLSRDTWPVDYSNPVELNRYAYVAGNPVNATDPSGLVVMFEQSAVKRTNAAVKADAHAAAYWLRRNIADVVRHLVVRPYLTGGCFMLGCDAILLNGLELLLNTFEQLSPSTSTNNAFTFGLNALQTVTRPTIGPRPRSTPEPETIQSRYIDRVRDNQECRTNAPANSSEQFADVDDLVCNVLRSTGPGGPDIRTWNIPAGATRFYLADTYALGYGSVSTRAQTIGRMVGHRISYTTLDASRLSPLMIIVNAGGNLSRASVMSTFIEEYRHYGQIMGTFQGQPVGNVGPALLPACADLTPEIAEIDAHLIASQWAATAIDYSRSIPMSRGDFTPVDVRERRLDRNGLAYTSMDSMRSVVEQHYRRHFGETWLQPRGADQCPR